MENLIAEYLNNITLMDSMSFDDYGDKTKLKNYNACADRNRKIARQIREKYSELKDTFYNLLFHENPSVRGWVAHHILEVMNYNEECQKNALMEIQFIADNDTTVNGLGNRMWLDDWFKKHPDSKA